MLHEEDRIALLRHMVLMRTIEEQGISLYKKGKIPGSFYDGRGQEAISVGATFALSPQDPVCSPLIRDLGAHLVRGVDLADLFRHYMGRENPISKGREGNIHFGDRRLGVVGPVSMLPDMMVVATGLAMAFQMRDERRCSLSFFGDGATSRGDWHEAMNWAAVERLPVVFMLEDNQLAYSTSQERQFAVHPVVRAEAYGVHAVAIDGNDVEAVFAATHEARARALRGDGPTLISATTMRMHGHGAHDDARYVDAELLAAWGARDPIAGYTARLEAAGVAVAEVQAEVDAAVAAAIEAALATPMADPATALDGVFATGEAAPIGTAAPAAWSGHRELVA
ncbi:thiamine pyrophosphate-dependent dehydrogenase E1 component subunit alpha [Conexibacter woesei]|uniref:2-oxoisovalerate dehydrogenase subunit alpha n=1 Tax=Conexibacter woesei (strain DSM 14684 / CCUG 47730 / CIP 108061 / JCM 11494 / NBRC 100937 / ID131577) TaxID=469383 RepID=D3F7S3_CONWI|nr:thiamine pyrophosphate-dependent dehydrogenase E1 component subunit alpha [Conexibacter woesei]ADB52817.1 Pyruvate dehydrogenase (acetyl-transferring) [Conexibacter woesei DSM 14684]